MTGSSDAESEMTLAEKLQKYIDIIAVKAMGTDYALKFERN